MIKLAVTLTIYLVIAEVGADGEYVPSELNCCRTVLRLDVFYHVEFALGHDRYSL